ncbi:cytochrome c biogenesis protein CcsA [Neobacillus sp. YIM B02564]|uniref:Cytochrome c biogenesis protein CcsA n=1 Tax=Neobacillus paridis TaxID=2803862 RepID=A0ABS1TTR8_9BACI|nr:cytochrome c biogenesis protein CcsA [Neobacillus paridis]MBL4953938.1 cytochrome c biogenesis protein CcsA [Neobacillus paridis]
MAIFIQIIVYASLILYIAASVLYFAGYRSEKNGMLKAASAIAIVGCIINFLALIIRTILSGRLPLSSGYEFILSFAFLTSLLYLIFEWKNKAKNAGGIVMIIAALLILAVIIIAGGQLDEVSPLMPALKSPWLTVHVLTAALAYASFALAAGLAIIQIRKIKQGNTAQDSKIYRVVAIGFMLLSFSIILGAIWAEQAWGAYWTWDPKEVWALVTWIIYAIYLHLHRRKTWRGARACWMVIAGFIIVLFTFFGVNFLFSGMHSYADSIDPLFHMNEQFL